MEDTSFFLPPPNILLKKAMIKIVWQPQTMHYLVWKNLQHFTLVTVTWSPCCVTHQFSSLPASWHRWVKYCCNRLMFTFVGHFPKYCLLAAQILLLSTGCSWHTAAVHMYSKIVRTYQINICKYIQLYYLTDWIDESIFKPEMKGNSGCNHKTSVDFINGILEQKF